MPPKKRPPLVSPEQKAKEAKKTCTCAMGMKPTLASAACWRNQILSENMITREWTKLYNPDAEEMERMCTERVMELDRTAARRRETNELRSLLLDDASVEGNGRKAYLAARNKLSPQEKWSNPVTQTHTIGWNASSIYTEGPASSVGRTLPSLTGANRMDTSVMGISPLAVKKELYDQSMKSSLRGKEKDTQIDLLANVSYIPC